MFRVFLSSLLFLWQKFNIGILKYGKYYLPPSALKMIVVEGIIRWWFSADNSNMIAKIRNYFDQILFPEKFGFFIYNYAQKRYTKFITSIWLSNDFDGITWSLANRNVFNGGMYLLYTYTHTYINIYSFGYLRPTYSKTLFATFGYNL